MPKPKRPVADKILLRVTCNRDGRVFYCHGKHYLSFIGKLFADAGFQDILIESELVAEGSTDGVITGHHYNMSIWAPSS